MTLFSHTRTSTIPPGTITIWSHPIEEIPDGWVLCDGSNSTPNLMGTFLRGSVSAGQSGGQSSYSIDISQLPSHNHGGSTTNSGNHIHGVGGRYYGRNRSSGYAGTIDWDDPNRTGSTRGSENGSHSHDVTIESAGSGSNSIDNNPRYATVAYIMKL